MQVASESLPKRITTTRSSSVTMARMDKDGGCDGNGDGGGIGMKAKLARIRRITHLLELLQTYGSKRKTINIANRCCSKDNYLNLHC